MGLIYIYVYMDNFVWERKTVMACSNFYMITSLASSKDDDYSNSHVGAFESLQQYLVSQKSWCRRPQVSHLAGWRSVSRIDSNGADHFCLRRLCRSNILRIELNVIDIHGYTGSRNGFSIPFCVFPFSTVLVVAVLSWDWTRTITIKLMLHVHHMSYLAVLESFGCVFMFWRSPSSAELNDQRCWNDNILILTFVKIMIRYSLIAKISQCSSP